MAVYKFVSSVEAVLHLLNGRLKFCPIDQLNDPSELASLIDVKGLEQSRDHYRSRGFHPEEIQTLQQQAELLRRVAPRFQRAPAPKTSDEARSILLSRAYDNTDLLLRYYEELIAELRNKLGAFCVSKRYDSLPMWAHYGANGHGFAVEFSGLENVFKGDPTGVLGKLIEISYSDLPVTVTFDPTSATKLFTWKFVDWSYEQEVRVLLPLDVCEKRLIQAGDLFIQAISPSHVSRVIIGPSTQRADIEVIEKQILASRNANHVTVSRFVVEGLRRRLVDLR